MRRRKPKQQNTYAFIDSQNLNLGTQKLGWKMDWRKFRQLLHEKYNVTKAFMFIGYMAENESLYEYMHELGYLVVLKPTHDMTRPQADIKEADKPEGEDKKTVKGNIDADLVLYAMKELPNYDKAIVVSGDGDFYALIEYLENQGKLSCIMAPNRWYSNLLNQFEKYIVRLDGMKKQLAYHDRKKK